MEIINCADCIYYAKVVYFGDNDVKQYYPYGMCSNTGKVTDKVVLGTSSCGKGIRRIKEKNNDR